VYAMRAASLCGVSPEAVQDEIKQLRRRKAASARRKDEREQLRPVRMSQPQAQGIRYENPRSAAAEQGVIRRCISTRSSSGTSSSARGTSPPRSSGRYTPR
ncbi:MAG: hypothetical protein ACLUEK_15625, partial [Oscillospiraceae bacterium]